MNAPCVRETELLAALAERGGAALPPELQRHVEMCRECRAVLTLAEAFRASADQSPSNHRMPIAAHVWWRAQVRARFEAAQDADRPMTVAQGLAAAAIGGIAASVIGIGWLAAPLTAIHDGLTWLTGSEMGLFSTALSTPPLVILAATTGVGVVVVVAVALIVVMSEKP
jgi:hypothetical protein